MFIKRLKAYIKASKLELFLTFAGVLSFTWLIIEPIGIFKQEAIPKGWPYYFGLIGFSAAVAFLIKFPKVTISKTLKAIDVKIEIKVGDLFSEAGNIVVGTNDVFDTELTRIISPSSLQGQFLLTVYQSDRKKLDADLESALAESKYSLDKITDPEKTVGKNSRYPIGTTVVLDRNNNKYFLSVYTVLSKDCKCEPTPVENIWKALTNIWEGVRSKGNGNPTFIPIIGSELARSGLPRSFLIKLIILSFVSCTKKEYISKKLTVLVHPNDFEFINMYDLKHFIDAVE